MEPQTCTRPATRISAPIHFGVTHLLSLEPSFQRLDVADRLLALSGPSVAAEPGHLPVRGDLAHIKLAGRCFVPHYAVPMPHRIKAGASLLAQGRAAGETIASLPAGAVFEVLDIAGAFAWGQVENDGLVGYVNISHLEPIA